MRKRTFLVLAPLLLFLAGCDLEDLGSSERYTADFHYGPLKAARLSVENFNGSIEIASWDQDSIDISGVKYAGTAELRDAIKIDVATAGDSLHVRTVRPSERRGNMGAKYVIKVPRKIELARITSSNGSIRVNDIEGAARLRSSNGGIHVINMKGNVDAQTSNGGINVHLTKADPGRPVKLDTSNGSIDLTVDSANQNDVYASTSNAGITVHMPPSIGARLRAHTSNGSITSAFEVQVQGQISKHSLEGTIGTGGPVLDLSTSNGGIRLEKL